MKRIKLSKNERIALTVLAVGPATAREIAVRGGVLDSMQTRGLVEQSATHRSKWALTDYGRDALQIL